MNRWFFVLMMFGCLLIGCNKSTDEELGIFKGSTKELLAQEVGAFKLNRAESLPKGDKTLTEMGAIDGAQSKYSSGKKELIFLVLNYDSPGSAKAGFNKWKQKMAAMNLKTQEEGQKVKGGANVGERIVSQGDSDFTAAKVVAWTNGTVLFMVSSRNKDFDSPLEFEKQFHY